MRKHIGLVTLLTLVLLISLTLPGICKTQIQFLVADGPPISNYLEDIVERFEELNPDIEVEIINTPWGEFKTKLMTMHAGKNAPNVHQIDDDQIPFYASKGLIKPLDGILERQGINKEDYFDIIWDLTSFEGEIYALTLALKPRATIYNKDMFAEAGITAPTKWEDAWTAEEFLTNARKLVKKNGDEIERYAWMWDYWCFDWIPFSNGGSFFSEDSTEYTFDEPESTEAVQWVADTAYKHEVAIPYTTAEQIGGDSLFISGKIAMYQTGVWSVDVLRDQTDVDWDVMPHFKLFEKAGTEASLFTFAIPENVENENATYKFARYLLSEESQKRLTGEGRFVPTKKSVAYSDVFLEPDKKPAHANIWLESLEYQGRWPFNVNGPQMRQLIAPQIDLIWAGEAKASEALKEPESEIEDLLKELQ